MSIQQNLWGNREQFVLQQINKDLKDDFKNFQLMTLKSFLTNYGTHESLQKYNCPITPNEHSTYEILVLVDTEQRTGTMKPSIRKGYRRFNKERRLKTRQQHSYTENILNRIHGYFCLEEIPSTEDNYIPESKNVVALSLICSSSYSDKKGVGSELMRLLMKIINDFSNFTDVILEVSNLLADNGSDDEEDDEDDEDDDEDTYEIPNKELITLITKEFSRKILRVKDGTPLYNVDSEYIFDIIADYLNDPNYDEDEDEDEYEEVGEDEYEEVGEDEDDYEEVGEDELDEVDEDEYEEDEENRTNSSSDSEYGGYWYTKGKESQIGLFKFYEKFGFVESPEIHTDWNVFGETPYPAMIYTKTF